mgnify:CR=1 FL=1
MVRGPFLLLLSLLSGCVVAVTVETPIDEPVDRIEVELDIGDVAVESASGPVFLKADLGGVGDGELTYEVVDRVLYVNAACGDLCAGDIEISAPRRTELAARVGIGSIDVVGLGGDLDLSLEAGDIVGEDLGADVATASSATGAIELHFASAPLELTAGTDAGDVDLEVPAGSYDLDLTASRGKVDTQGVSHDPDAAGWIRAYAKAGSVTVRGK